VRTFVSFVVLGIEPKASYMLGMYVWSYRGVNPSQWKLLNITFFYSCWLCWGRGETFKIKGGKKCANVGSSKVCYPLKEKTVLFCSFFIDYISFSFKLRILLTHVSTQINWFH
jgi:hypothetical protein